MAFDSFAAPRTSDYVKSQLNGKLAAPPGPATPKPADKDKKDDDEEEEEEEVEAELHRGGGVEEGAAEWSFELQPQLATQFEITHALERQRFEVCLREYICMCMRVRNMYVHGCVCACASVTLCCNA